MSDTTDERPVALVTGAGTGIGTACARALAAEGFRVGIHYRSSEEGAKKLSAELDGSFTIKADLSDGESIDAMIKELQGKIDTIMQKAAAASESGSIDGVAKMRQEKAA